MRQQQIDALGAEAFAQLVSLLRPVARCQAGGDGFPGAERAEAPGQRIEMRLHCEGGTVTTDLEVWLPCPPTRAVVAVWVLPLPSGAAVEGLALHRASHAGERAGLCERREARTWFDLARRAGLPGAILSEDAPGVFSLEVASPAGRAVCAALRYSYRRPAAEDGEISLRCEAAPGALPIAAQRPRIVRLGSGRSLDRLVGITSSRASASVETLGRVPLPQADASRGADPSPRPDVFASYDRAGGSNAMFRGTLAGRRVRLWAELRAQECAESSAELPAGGATARPTGSDLDRLMEEYRRPERTEAERRALAAEVVRLGLEIGRATLWTSFVAVVGGEGPGGEMVFAAA